MKFCEYCQRFSGKSRVKAKIRGVSSQAAIPEYLMSIALGDKATSELTFSEDLFRKWYKGDRVPVPHLWARICEAFDIKAFSRTLSNSLDENNIRELMQAFGITIGPDDVTDKYALASALAAQFKAIAEGNGEAPDIVCEVYSQYFSVSEFPNYIKNAVDKYSMMKTLLYTQEHPFEEFFVCNTISTFIPKNNKTIPEKIIKNVTMQDLVPISRYVILVGMGGIGKSMMMRHLFLSSMKSYQNTGILPILVTLREYSQTNNDVFNLIVDSVHRFDITFSAMHVNKLLTEGKCQLLLDGLDEIKVSDMSSFLRNLDALIDRYPQNQYVMSSRNISSFVELPRFSTMVMMPFDKTQALELIDKLEYCPEEPKLKQQFRERLEHEYFLTHTEFVRNPLLLTLMLMNYRRFSDVPEKKYLFYEEAYLTLLQRHDADKLAYKRVFRSVNDPSDFTLVFREFCAKSYRKGDYEFGRKKFEEYFNTLHSITRTDPNMMKPDNFLYDACHSVCLMYEEGEIYHFLHRSFQEYFFADYYSRQDDTTLKKLGAYFGKTNRMIFDDVDAFDMLYDLEPEKVERFIFIPYLEKFFRVKNKNVGYWTFLSTCFSDWTYVQQDKKITKLFCETNGKHAFLPISRDYIIPSSVIISLILKLLDLQLYFSMPSPEENYPNLIDGVLLGREVNWREQSIPYIALVSCSKQHWDTNTNIENGADYRNAIKGPDGRPIIFGHSYQFDFSKGLTEPEKYPEIIALWDNESCPAKDIFKLVNKYYDELVAKYSHIDDIDDDDF